MMVGREIELGRREGDGRTPREPVLVLDGVCADGDRGTQALSDISFSLRGGEIMAVAGVAGNGQRELAETIAGMRPATSGTIHANGRRLRSGDPRHAIAVGIAYVPEDRLGTGVAPGLSVASNLVLKSYRRAPASRGPFLLLGRIRELARRAMRNHDVRASSPDVPARQLSGGNLQKVVLAREFTGAPEVVVAASPTRGLDVAAIETVHKYLRDAAAYGIGVLLISEDLDEILALADRIVVMYEGAIVGERDARTATVEELGLLMAGGEDGAD
jgi:simple sugar transport system ATP-binding protein